MENLSEIEKPPEGGRGMDSTDKGLKPLSLGSDNPPKRVPGLLSGDFHEQAASLVLDRIALAEPCR